MTNLTSAKITETVDEVGLSEQNSSMLLLLLLLCYYFIFCLKDTR